ncbi:unnamed protein product [Linum tenue]|uniref:Uncharacterized protein n=1 Tax=Linum tenue TaxID=586396 RepID=A0AAV0JFT0_9ROSI|nr:unnamed protein product [Linum tenue]
MKSRKRCESRPNSVPENHVEFTGCKKVSCYFNQCRLTDTCKDYTIKALINTIDHLGSVAYKVNSFLDQTANEVAAVELRFYSLEQVIDWTMLLM